jgi:hypothetical protein
MNMRIIDPTKPQDWRKTVLVGPPLSLADLHKQLLKARPSATALERKRDRMMNQILRRQNVLLRKAEAHDGRTLD